MIRLINSVIGFISGILVGLIVVAALSPVISNGPSSNEVMQLFFREDDGTCYKLYPQMHICPIKKSMK